MKNREMKLAYIAGAMDGDGSFSLIKSQSDGRDIPVYYPMVQLANCRKSLVDFLKDELGGGYTIRESWVANDGRKRKTSYGWKIARSATCLPIINELIPYLVVKKQRAEFLRDYVVNNPSQKNKGPLSDSLLINRERAYLKMRSFNDIPNTKCELFGKSHRIDNDSELFWAYVAGLMDTDGSFSLKKTRPSGESKGHTYTATILLTMTDCRAIYHIMNNFSLGNMMVIKAKTAANGFCYRFSITSRKNAALFIMKCMPFLFIKKLVAEKLLEFCKLVTPMGGSRGVSSEQLLFRENYYNAIKELNYGVDKSSLMDLELLPDNAGDNKAQAAKACSVNVASEKTLKDDAVL